MIELEGDHLESKFVVATTDYDSGGSNSGSGSGSVKREKSESVSQRKERERVERESTELRGNGVNGRLFNDPTPSPASQRQSQQQQEEDEDEDFGGMEDQLGFDFDDAEAAFGEIDRLSQVALSQQPQQSQPQQRQQPQPQELVRDTSEAGPSNRSGSRGERFEEDEEFGKSPEPEGTDQMDLGPTQRYVLGTGEERPSKKVSWTIISSLCVLVLSIY